MILSFKGRMPPNEPMEEKVWTAGKGMGQAWNPNHFGSTTLPWWKNIGGCSVSKKRSITSYCDEEAFGLVP